MRARNSLEVIAALGLNVGTFAGRQPNRSRRCLDDEARWLAPNIREVGRVPPLSRPHLTEAMSAHPVSMRVNDPANDPPECVAALEGSAGRSPTLAARADQAVLHRAGAGAS